MSRMRIGFLAAALALFLVNPPAVFGGAMHDGDGMTEDAQPAYPGSGQVGRALSPDAQGQVLGMRSLGVTLLSWLSLQDLPGNSGRASDIWAYRSPSGREYALIGLEKGTAFVDITDPVSPVISGYISSPTSIWKEVTTHGEYAYVVTEAGGGMQVIDMRQIDQRVVTLVRNVTAEGLNSTHTIRMNATTPYVYLNGSNIHNGGLVVFDVSDPANPQFAGSWDENYVHDAIITSYDEGPYGGREIAFACLGPVGLGILDVTDKSNITTLSITTYPNVTYCHYGWLDQSKTVFYINDEGDEAWGPGVPTTTYVMDVQSLADPQFVTSFTNGNPAIDHNPIGRGHFLFEANYRSGLRIYDIADLDNVVEVGYFDTYPADDEPHFNGAWGSDLLPSGSIIISDIERGLFVFDASSVTAVDPWGPIAHENARLLYSYPNPGRERVNLGFELSEPGRASLQIVDVAGRLVATLADGNFYAKRTELSWEVGRGTAMPSGGVYFAVLRTEKGQQSEPIVIAR